MPFFDFVKTNTTTTSVGSGVEYLNDLLDVIITGQANGDLLIFNGTDWINRTLLLSDLPAISLNDLSDVAISGLSNPAFLMYTAIDGWTNVNAATVVTNLGLATVATTGDYNDLINLPTLVDVLNDLSDVSGTPSTSDVLTYTGSGWEPQAPATTGAEYLNELLDVEVLSATDGALLQYVGGSEDLWVARNLLPNTVPFNNVDGEIESNVDFSYDPFAGTVSAGGYLFTAGGGMQSFFGLGGSLEGPSLSCFVWFESPLGTPQAAFQGATSCAGHFTINNTFDLKLATTGGTISVSPPSSISGSYTLTLPPNDGNTGDIVRCTDGAGTLGFIGTRGTSFPSSPVEGDLFYRSDLDCLFFYDGTTWLSVETWTNGASYSGDMAISTMFGAEAGTGFGSNVGMRMPYTSRLVWLTLQNSNSSNFTIDILVNNTLSTSVSVTGARGQQWATSVALAAGDYISFRNASGSNALLDPILLFGIKRRV